MKSPHAREKKAAPGGALPPAEPTNIQQGSSSAAGAVAPRADNDADATAGGQEATPLMFLTASTRKFASWDVSMSQPRIEEYTYTWKNKSRTAKNFRCALVFVHDHAQYCLAEVRKAKGDPADVIEEIHGQIQGWLTIPNIPGGIEW